MIFIKKIRFLFCCIASFLLVFEASAQRFSVTGRVYDAITEQNVPEASIEIFRITKVFINGGMVNKRSRSQALSADSTGQFRATLPLGEYVFETSSIGFLKKSKFLNLSKNTVFNIDLTEEVNQLETVEIAVRKAESNVKSVEMGTIKINLQALKTNPIVFGEADIIRSLTLQPGVTNVGEGAGGFSVRGGRVDQNLVLLDDAPIFNTSHLLGLFTSVNSESIQNATLYKAGIPARYGGRLSSLLQMNTKLGSQEKRTAIGSGPISSNLLFERPFAKKRGSLMLAGRAAYPNWLIGSIPRRFKGSKASFFDLNGSLQYRLNNANSVSATAYQSNDAFKFPEDTSYFWNSTISTVQWSSQLNAKLSMTTKGILSHYTYGVLGLAKDFQYQQDSKIRHHEIRHEYLYERNVEQKFEWGGNVIFYRFSPGNRKPTDANSLINEFSLADENGREAAVFGSYDWSISKRISLQAGLRYSSFQNLGGTVFTYKSNQPIILENTVDTLSFDKNKANASFGGFEPRFLIKFELADNQSVKMSYNRTRQYIHLITNTTAISPIDYWKLSNRYAPPQLANLYSLGYYRNFNDNMFITNVEGFYKTMNQLIEYKDGASLPLNPHLETELLSAKGYAYGGEASIQKNKGSLTGFINYTYSRAFIATQSPFLREQINAGKYYPSIFDKPHNLTVSAQWATPSGWSLASNFLYQTGRPLTFPDGQYLYNGALVFNYSARYTGRLPDYHRLDLSLSYNSKKNKEQKKYSILNISFYNLYARRNPYSIFFRQFFGVPKSYRLSVLGTVIPSISLTKYW